MLPHSRAGDIAGAIPATMMIQPIYFRVIDLLMS